MSTEEINGHEIEHETRSYYGGSSVIYRCVNDGCYVEASGEFGARERIVELTEQFECPSGTGDCTICGHDIDPEADICSQCNLEATVSDRIYHHD